MNIWSDSYYTNLIGILIALLCIVVAYFKYKFTYWSKRNIPYLEPTIPFGNLKDFILQRKTIGESITELYQKLKVPGRRYAGFYMSSKPELLLLDPELIKNVMASDFNHFRDRGVETDEKKEPLTGHLFALPGTKWKNLRQKLTPTFTSGKMKMMFHTLVDCTSGLDVIMEAHIENSKPIDIKEILGRFTTDIIGSCAFGIECNSLKDPDAIFRKMGKKMMEPDSFRVFKRLIMSVFPRLFKLLPIPIMDKTVSSFFKNVVKETVEHREQNNVKRNDFMQLLINIRNTGNVDGNKNDNVTGNGLTMGEIGAQVLIFFIAGFETSSTTMTFFFHDICQNPDIQEKIRQEINDMLKRYDNKITYEGMMELPYLDQAIKESMRLRPALSILQRKCTAEYKIPDSDTVIDKGTMVIIPVHGLQTDPEYYPEPEKYDPDRFSPEEREKRHPFTFLPFGEGPRNCIGLRFGMLQTKVGIVALMRNYRFTLNKKTKLPLKMKPKSFIFAAEGEVWLNAERISN